MKEIIRQIIVEALESKGYGISDEWDGVHVAQEDTSIGVKITVEVEP